MPLGQPNGLDYWTPIGGRPLPALATVQTTLGLDIWLPGGTVAVAALVQSPRSLPPPPAAPRRRPPRRRYY